MRRPRIESLDSRSVFCHESHAWGIETLEEHTRQHRIELGSQDRVYTGAAPSRGVREGELVAAAPLLPVLLDPRDENHENDLKTVRPCADRLEVHAVHPAIAGEIERPPSGVPWRRARDGGRTGSGRV